MKTTLELPDALYHQAKTRAAADKRKMKDLVSEGLELVLASRHSRKEGTDERQQVLHALDAILRSPPLPLGRVAALQAESQRLREEGWSRKENGA